MQQPAEQLLANSPIQACHFHGHKVFIKRDDLLHAQFSGNKARKFAYFLAHDFPNVKTLVGYGSVQANSLYSLAALAKLKGWQLNFYSKPIPHWLKAQPTGNYSAALKLGAKIIEVKELTSNLEAYVQSLDFDRNHLSVPEGGRCQEAAFGVKQLANELIQQCQELELNNPVFMLPAGTGTTALYLQKYLPFQVMTCACVGTPDYLKQQFNELDTNSTHWPTILPSRKKYHFGKLYAEFYQIWQQLKAQTGIEFELLYDPLGWLCLLDFLKARKSNQDIIYIHQGGLVGNQSMLPRYQLKYPQESAK
ncbi:1-aminocyclopropane-1-carboxylate deaminase/D-cysteine desulfhydrase [Litorilituus sediminis]|uniref:1-aminocyclopropane-1-carboxylate deaminase/D-cysteine desulfhydrase n=1 Tax=Litorilituus sediminis TaxID=718192 RepID=A0A4P6P8R9_9GAMM|nr:1-aminocyclopropane-1-carboxylate deaminase/D-cysteine desulfhydrase [Litorilituus sediminis]QBG35887.1 1-aminocyclopropane-1-carboxylate deaminase/D-cysteine desulfhydrase [Litorilituus sediminis]